jgi:hypothetical protein
VVLSIDPRLCKESHEHPENQTFEDQCSYCVQRLWTAKLMPKRMGSFSKSNANEIVSSAQVCIVPCVKFRKERKLSLDHRLGRTIQVVYTSVRSFTGIARVPLTKHRTPTMYTGPIWPTAEASEAIQTVVLADPDHAVGDRARSWLMMESYTPASM